MKNSFIRILFLFPLAAAGDFQVVHVWNENGLIFRHGVRNGFRGFLPDAVNFPAAGANNFLFHIRIDGAHGFEQRG